VLSPPSYPLKEGQTLKRSYKYKKINVFTMLGMGLFDEVVKIINQWRPQKKYPNETKYRDDLMNFIHDRLNDPRKNMFFGRRNVLVRKEDSRSLCDIAVERSVGIELKFGKNGKISKKEIDRLHGQIGGYRKEYSEGIIVVLVGEVDKFSEAEVRKKLEDLYDLINRANFGLQQFRIKLINKSDSKIRKSGEKSQIFGLDFNPFG